MNRTLLLILCDFLLLNLLALTRWEQAEPPPVTKPPVPNTATNGPGATQGQDLVDTMKLTLADERLAREQLAQQLQTKSGELESRDKSLATLQSEKSQLTATLDSAKQASEELARKAAAAAQDASVTKERLAQIQRELDEKRRLAEQQQQQLATLEQQQSEARQRIEGLTVAVKVAEQEKQLLRETADTLKVQVNAERQERLKVQETTVQLAQGVGQLAEKSTELTKEIRDNRPVNANTLFSEFLANRVRTAFTAERKTFMAPVARAKESRTILVSDGKATYALLHLDDTTLNLRENAVDWSQVTASFMKDSYKAAATRLEFSDIDPRIVFLPITEAQVQALGAKVYQTALDPFKFPEAVLISNGGAGYGEVPFKLDPTYANYVRMDNRLVRRLFGDFSPSRGDLVLSKTGELLGVMVNSEYCVVINHFKATAALTLGTISTDAPTGPMFEALSRRYRSLPQRMQ
ncbi:MAG: hypothetical protein JNN01_15310 [Opitutaceae bacterium]|nr:hypothetical protein [Opitutaceae bacterium]